MKARNRFSATLRGSRKTSNAPSAEAAKVRIRNLVLAEIGAEKASVFDAFAGQGEMHRQVWSAAASYVGCDTTWFRDQRLMFVADNRRVMRAIDLNPSNVFDLDAYGSPWEQVIILCARRQLKPKERIGLVLTEGSGLKIKMGSLPHALAQLTGLRPHAAGAGRAFDQVLARAIAAVCRRLRCRILKRWEAHGKTGSKMVYLGLVLEGISGAAPAARE